MLSLFFAEEVEDEEEDVDEVAENEVDLVDFSLYVSRSFELGALLAPLLCFSLYSFDEPLLGPLPPPPPPDDLLEPFELLVEDDPVPPTLVD